MIAITTIPAIITGAAVQKIEYTLASSTVNDRPETSFAWTIGALPANSRVLGVEYETDFAWSHTSTATHIWIALYESGTDANSIALIYNGELMSAAGLYGQFDGNNVGLPQENYQTRGGQDLDLFITANGGGLQYIADGCNVTVRVFYAVIA